MVATVALPSLSARRPIGLGSIIALGMALSILSVRAIETSGDAVGFTRVLVSAISIGVFFLVRRYSLVKGILLALAIELVAGTTIFLAVDLPFLNEFSPAIQQTTVSVLTRLSQPSAPASVTLALK